MSFQVNPGEVANYGKLIERNSVNLAVVNTHLAQYTNLGSTDGAFLQILVGAHNETVARMRDSIYRGFNAMGNSATELKATADFYANQDQTSAANLDATYPKGVRPAVNSPDMRRPADLEGKQGPYVKNAGYDVEDPLKFLTPPAQPQEFSDPMKLFNVLSDLVSPTWWINQVLNDTIGVNPLKVMQHYFIGDWEGFARCGLVWDDLSKATGAIGENVKGGLTWLASEWQGNAADAAIGYFDYMRRSLQSHRDVLHKLHDEYLEVARGVWNAARSLSDIFKMFMDNLIVAGIAVLGAAAFSWTGVGAGISLLVAGYQCKRLFQLWDEATGLISKTQSGVEAFVGFLQSKQAEVLRDITPQPMPATDYDHPGAVPAKAGPRAKGE